jgi:hypothetical protein
MTKFNLLADSQSEILVGGTWGYKAPKCPTPKCYAPAHYSTTLSNTVVIGQSNNATNVGLGIGGFGSASSFQGNSADVINIIG